MPRNREQQTLRENLGSLSKSKWHKTMDPGWISLCGRKSPLGTGREAAGYPDNSDQHPCPLYSRWARGSRRACQTYLSRDFLICGRKTPQRHTGTSLCPRSATAGPRQAAAWSKTGIETSLSWDLLCDESGRKIKDVVLASLRVELSKVFCSWLSA